MSTALIKASRRVLNLSPERAWYEETERAPNTLFARLQSVPDRPSANLVNFVNGTLVPDFTQLQTGTIKKHIRLPLTNLPGYPDILSDESGGGVLSRIIPEYGVLLEAHNASSEAFTSFRVDDYDLVEGVIRLKSNAPALQGVEFVATFYEYTGATLQHVPYVVDSSGRDGSLVRRANVWLVEPLNGNTVVTTTDSIVEGGRLFYTQERFDAAFSLKSTDDLQRGVSTPRVRTSLARKPAHNDEVVHHRLHAFRKPFDGAPEPLLSASRKPLRPEPSARIDMIGRPHVHEDRRRRNAHEEDKHYHLLARKDGGSASHGLVESRMHEIAWRLSQPKHSTAAAMVVLKSDQAPPSERHHHHRRSSAPDGGLSAPAPILGHHITPGQYRHENEELPHKNSHARRPPLCTLDTDAIQLRVHRCEMMRMPRLEKVTTEEPIKSANLRSKVDEGTVAIHGPAPGVVSPCKHELMEMDLRVGRISRASDRHLHLHLQHAPSSGREKQVHMMKAIVPSVVPPPFAPLPASSHRTSERQIILPTACVARRHSRQPDACDTNQFFRGGRLQRATVTHLPMHENVTSLNLRSYESQKQLEQIDQLTAQYSGVLRSVEAIDARIESDVFPFANTLVNEIRDDVHVLSGELHDVALAANVALHGISSIRSRISHSIHASRIELMDRLDTERSLTEERIQSGLVEIRDALIPEIEPMAKSSVLAEVEQLVPPAIEQEVSLQSALIADEIRAGVANTLLSSQLMSSGRWHLQVLRHREVSDLPTEKSSSSHIQRVVPDKSYVHDGKLADARARFRTRAHGAEAIPLSRQTPVITETVLLRQAYPQALSVAAAVVSNLDTQDINDTTGLFLTRPNVRKAGVSTDDIVEGSLKYYSSSAVVRDVRSGVDVSDLRDTANLLISRTNLKTHGITSDDIFEGDAHVFYTKDRFDADYARRDTERTVAQSFHSRVDRARNHEPVIPQTVRLPQHARGRNGNGDAHAIVSSTRPPSAAHKREAALIALPGSNTGSNLRVDLNVLKASTNAAHHRLERMVSNAVSHANVALTGLTTGDDVREGVGGLHATRLRMMSGRHVNPYELVPNEEATKRMPPRKYGSEAPPQRHAPGSRLHASMNQHASSDMHRHLIRTRHHEGMVQRQPLPTMHPVFRVAPDEAIPKTPTKSAMAASTHELELPLPLFASGSTCKRDEPMSLPQYLSTDTVQRGRPHIHDLPSGVAPPIRVYHDEAVLGRVNHQPTIRPELTWGECLVPAFKNHPKRTDVPRPSLSEKKNNTLHKPDDERDRLHEARRYTAYTDVVRMRSRFHSLNDAFARFTDQNAMAVANVEETCEATVHTVAHLEGNVQYLDGLVTSARLDLGALSANSIANQYSILDAHTKTAELQGAVGEHSEHIGNLQLQVGRISASTLSMSSSLELHSSHLDMLETVCSQNEQSISEIKAHAAANALLLGTALSTQTGILHSLDRTVLDVTLHESRIGQLSLQLANMAVETDRLSSENAQVHDDLQKALDRQASIDAVHDATDVSQQAAIDSLTNSTAQVIAQIDTIMPKLTTVESGMDSLIMQSAGVVDDLSNVSLSVTTLEQDSAVFRANIGDVSHRLENVLHAHQSTSDLLLLRMPVPALKNVQTHHDISVHHRGHCLQQQQQQQQQQRAECNHPVQIDKVRVRQSEEMLPTAMAPPRRKENGGTMPSHECRAHRWQRKADYIHHDFLRPARDFRAVSSALPPPRPKVLGYEWVRVQSGIADLVVRVSLVETSSDWARVDEIIASTSGNETVRLFDAERTMEITLPRLVGGVSHAVRVFALSWKYGPSREAIIHAMHESKVDVRPGYGPHAYESNATLMVQGGMLVHAGDDVDRFITLHMSDDFHAGQELTLEFGMGNIHSYAPMGMQSLVRHATIWLRVGDTGWLDTTRFMNRAIRPLPRSTGDPCAVHVERVADSGLVRVRLAFGPEPLPVGAALICVRATKHAQYVQMPRLLRP